MAYNPNVPAPANLVQDDIVAMRENFQHLDPLAQVVGELQTVSGLAPITGDLQVVSELAPYVQALIDSRIVEMGSNANGEYVRWENGLQVCWQIGLTIDEFFNRFELRKTWLFPAMFASVTVAFMVVDASTDGALKTTLLRSLQSATPSIGIRAISGFGTYEDGDTVRVSVFAIGRWK